jgi:GTP-binding protein
MKIKSSEFITSAVSKAGAPKRRLPEIAISGRSNVGKSSLINSILNRRKIAKISATPGKTRLINYFLINDSFYFVDLPGYGYAKASKQDINTWKTFIESYLKENQNLKAILQLIDIRHELKDNDKMMVEYMEHYQIPCIIVLTKADKLNQTEVMKQLKYFSDLFPGFEIIVTSAEKGTGKDTVINSLEKFL